MFSKDLVCTYQPYPCSIRLLTTTHTLSLDLSAISMQHTSILLDVLHNVFSGGFKIRQERGLVRDPLKVVQGDGHIDCSRHRYEINICKKNVFELIIFFSQKCSFIDVARYVLHIRYNICALYIQYMGIVHTIYVYCTYGICGKQRPQREDATKLLFKFCVCRAL